MGKRFILGQMYSELLGGSGTADQSWLFIEISINSW